ncbi:MAG: hypothetical protein HQ507_09380 [Candidatus Marinimicrobia bacterium]|nr:hypothetical protein [Candidatus Neomarinimicrobiota bacterium]
MLNRDQIDALAEMINTSLTAAAHSLSEIVETEVIIDVPHIQVYTSDDQARLNPVFGLENTYATVKQDFQGNLSGTAIIAFPSEGALQLISLLTDLVVSDEELDIIQSGTFLEIGNIINNAFLGSLNNQFDFHVHYALPEFNEVSIPYIIDATFRDQKQGGVIVTNTTFIVKSKNIEGHILLLFKVIDMDFLKRKLNQMIDGS